MGFWVGLNQVMRTPLPAEIEVIMKVCRLQQSGNSRAKFRFVFVMGPSTKVHTSIMFDVIVLGGFFGGCVSR